MIWEDNIKVKLGEVYCEDMKPTELVWIRVECRDFVSVVSMRYQVNIQYFLSFTIYFHLPFFFRFGINSSIKVTTLQFQASERDKYD
jgi:hypothetical protein